MTRLRALAGLLPSAMALSASVWRAESTQQHPAATPRRGTVMQEIVYAENTEVPGPGDR